MFVEVIVLEFERDVEWKLRHKIAMLMEHGMILDNYAIRDNKKKGLLPLAHLQLSYGNTKATGSLLYAWLDYLIRWWTKER